MNKVEDDVELYEFLTSIAIVSWAIFPVSRPGLEEEEEDGLSPLPLLLCCTGLSVASIELLLLVGVFTPCSIYCPERQSKMGKRIRSRR